jgi:hypothetical protein
MPCSFVERLFDWHGSHMKATRTTWWSVGRRSVGLWSREILVPGIILIFDDPDVSRGRPRRYVSFGRLGQLFELTFLPTSLEGATPRCWNIALRHWSEPRG